MIQDSGERREFPSGAVRDTGKGRCDLLPLDIAADLLRFSDDITVYDGLHPLTALCLFMQEPYNGAKDAELVYKAIKEFCDWNGWDIPTMLLEVSEHFAEGSAKYGERNWEKGIPTHCYIDSCVRHFLKWSRGDTDERHDRAFCWNLICLMWTLYHRPECDDIQKKEVVGHE